ncbi:unnamed protein product [Candidula unifasciata]|uniref:C3H1-type domain-containing protein n=1 Tax=Candidula unifasciata TaxID=100452 RepID=A0A8S4A2G2_9EUPU|nr:unnamed protein product [Candidula unifasciata]
MVLESSPFMQTSSLPGQVSADLAVTLEETFGVEELANPKRDILLGALHERIDKNKNSNVGLDRAVGLELGDKNCEVGFYWTVSVDSNNKNNFVGSNGIVSFDSGNQNSGADFDNFDSNKKILQSHADKNSKSCLDRFPSLGRTDKSRTVDRFANIDSIKTCRTADIDEVASLGSNFPIASSVLHGSPQQDTDIGKDNDVCGLTQILPGSIHTNQLQTMSTETLNDSHSGLTHHDFSSLDDIEADCTADPASDLNTTTLFDFFDGAISPDAAVLSSSFSSSDEEEGVESLDVDRLLKDPRCVKRFEQALKLGYSETSIVKVLQKLSPECGLNDLLSGLISLDDSSPDDVFSHKPQTNAGLGDWDVANYTSWGMTLSNSAGVSEKSIISPGRKHDILNVDWRNNLHYIIIDGSNVAMSHGKNVFSCRGIQIAVEWFQARGHENITVFIPQWRKEASRPDALITDQDILYELEKQGIVVFTPARRVKGRRVVCYDDRFILKLAVETDGIVVSNDVYRDLVREREEFRHVVDQRLLMYSFVNDRFMPPEDPLGRMGPTLDDFLCKTPLQRHPKPQTCPYGKKCTYGNKCRFYHPERGFVPQKSITETLKEHAQLKLQERASKMLKVAEKERRYKQKLSRAKSMIPSESVPALSSPADTGEARRKQGKPKLGHSKSLILPEKSSDYLNEPRKKLEEAELAVALGQMIIGDLSFVEKSSLNVFDSDNSVKLLESNPSSAGASTRQDEASIENTLASDGQLTPSSVLNVSNTKSEVYPTLQNIEPLESQERYVSGHLLLAKKLSYENKESNFFSDHLLNSSSAQISDQAIFLGKTNEHVQGELRSRQDIKFSTSLGSSQVYPVNKPQSQQVYMPVMGHYPGLARSMSTNAHTHSAPLFLQQIDSRLRSPPYRHEILDGRMFSDCLDRRSPDSGIYTSAEGVRTTFPSHTEGHFQVYNSYPPLNNVQPAIAQKLMGLHRAYSSTDNVRTAEEFQRKLAMRRSSSSTSQFGSDHMAPNHHPHHGMLAQLAPTPCQLGQSPGLRRQNSISDPEIHSSSGGGKFPNGLSSVYQDTHANNPNNYYSSRNQQFPKQFQYFHQQNFQQSYQHEQHNSHDIFTTQQQHQQQMESSQPPPFILKSRLANWEQSLSSANLDLFSPVETATQHGQYNPNPNTIQSPNNSQIPYFPQCTVTPLIQETSGSHIYNSSYSQSSVPYPQPSTVYRPTNSSLSVVPSTVPSLHSYPMLIQQNSTPQNSSQSLQPVVNCQIVEEDSEILPNDPRYTIYYHLSSVFGEQIVRKVLNLHPDVKDPTQICQLLMKFKENGC